MCPSVDISPPVFRALLTLREERGGSLDDIASGLLAEALRARRERERAPVLEWRSRPMGAKVDPVDKDALYAILDDPRP